MDRLFIIRHGMRLDFENPRWVQESDRPWDPPLSPYGFEIARETGVFLSKRGIDRIYTSPFLRTVQTASCLTPGRGVPVFLETGLMEFLLPAYIAWAPMFLPFESLHGSCPCLHRESRAQFPVQWPEGDEEHWGPMRMGRVLAGLDLGGTAALVTHGAIVRATVRHLTGGRQVPHTGLCAVNELERKGDHWELVYAGQGHLRNPEPTYPFA